LVGELTGSDQWRRLSGRAPSCGGMTERMMGGEGEIAVLHRLLIRNHFIHHHWRRQAVGWRGARKAQEDWGGVCWWLKFLEVTPID
jgi:hypothetical protein